MSKINDAYIRARFGKDLPKKNVDNLRTAMQKYGENYWWDSKDSVQVAMYQIFENFLMVDFSLFHEGLEKLVGRPVWTHELGLNVEGIRDEARLGIKRLKTRIGISDEQKQEAIKRSIQMLEDYCQKNGKKLFKVDLSEKSDRDENGIDRSGEDGYLNLQ